MYCTCKKGYIWNTCRCICEYKKYSKSIADDSVIVRNKIISLTNSVSENVTNTGPTKVS